MPPDASPAFDATLHSPRIVLRGETDGAQLLIDGRLALSWQDPLDALAWLPESRDTRGVPKNARWKGYLSYDLGRLFEHLPPPAPHGRGLPLFEFGISDEQNSAPASVPPPQPRTIRRSTFTRDGYIAAVERCLDYIRAGDVFQINLSQVFTVALEESPWTVWSRLRDAVPARYGAFQQFDDVTLLSNSPELFLRVTPDRRVTTRPIKGTRPRLPGMDAKLRDSAKDQAELNMIVDLERNDLGRVCRTGSVKVTQARTIEDHATVYHGVATVEGLLRPDVTFLDLLRATFPGGSVTGAPKIRAMQIIDELEPVSRGPYCGAVGYLDPDGTFEFNVAIRTMIVTPDGLVRVPAGGGIVADSDPAAEYEETLVKARAMLRALGVVE